MSERDDIVLDMTVRIIVDDVSDGKGTEFRASVWADDELISDDYGKSVSDAVTFAMCQVTDG